MGYLQHVIYQYYVKRHKVTLENGIWWLSFLKLSNFPRNFLIFFIEHSPGNNKKKQKKIQFVAGVQKLCAYVHTSRRFIFIYIDFDIVFERY